MAIYQLVSEDGSLFFSQEPGALGGNSRCKIYGLLNCKSANNAIAKGGYVKHRIFFKDEETAIKAGYRPCAKCMPEKYKEWKEQAQSNISYHRGDFVEPLF